MAGFLVNIAVTGSRTVTASGLGLVTASGSIFAETADAIVVDGYGQVVIAGTVAATGPYDAVQSSNNGVLQMTVADSGVLSGQRGVQVDGTGTTIYFDNAGFISGLTAGVSLLGVGASMINSGHIAGFGSTGLYVGTTSYLYVQNSGSIDGTTYGVYRYNAGSTHIVNSGTITGSAVAIRLDAGARQGGQQWPSVGRSAYGTRR